MSDRADKYRSWIFPDPADAGEDGLLAQGGDLAIPVLLEAYSMGIFPWYAEGSPILWWSPDPRMVLFPQRFKVSKSLQQSVRNKNFRVVFDSDFTTVIESCARILRKGQPGTWITPEMKTAYVQLHQAGYAHSVETYLDGQMVGGLYGVSLGGVFFGESMFHSKRDASKAALYHLVQQLRKWDFDLIDVQQSTAHLKSLGAEDVPRDEFLALLNKSLKTQTRRGNWGQTEKAD